MRHVRSLLPGLAVLTVALATSEVLRPPQLEGLPTTVILDREHRVAAWKVGPVKRGQIRRALAALLATD